MLMRLRTAARSRAVNRRGLRKPMNRAPRTPSPTEGCSSRAAMNARSPDIRPRRTSGAAWSCSRTTTRSGAARIAASASRASGPLDSDSRTPRSTGSCSLVCSVGSPGPSGITITVARSAPRARWAALVRASSVAAMSRPPAAIAAAASSTERRRASAVATATPASSARPRSRLPSPGCTGGRAPLAATRSPHTSPASTIGDDATSPPGASHSVAGSAASSFSRHDATTSEWRPSPSRTTAADATPSSWAASWHTSVRTSSGSAPEAARVAARRSAACSAAYPAMRRRCSASLIARRTRSAKSTSARSASAPTGASALTMVRLPQGCAVDRDRRREALAVRAEEVVAAGARQEPCGPRLADGGGGAVDAEADHVAVAGSGHAGGHPAGHHLARGLVAQAHHRRELAAREPGGLLADERQHVGGRRPGGDRGRHPPQRRLLLDAPLDGAPVLRVRHRQRHQVGEGGQARLGVVLQAGRLRRRGQHRPPQPAGGAHRRRHPAAQPAPDAVDVRALRGRELVQVHAGRDAGRRGPVRPARRPRAARARRSASPRRPRTPRPGRPRRRSARRPPPRRRTGPRPPGRRSGTPPPAPTRRRPPSPPGGALRSRRAPTGGRCPSLENRRPARSRLSVPSESGNDHGLLRNSRMRST